MRTGAASGRCGSSSSCFASACSPNSSPTTGHTADDQAETVLLNLLRGAATDGLAAMRSGPRHPILGLRRAETHNLCSQLGLRPRGTPTTRDPAYLRNRIRHELVPVLCELADRDIVPILARQARLLADDAALLGKLAAALDPTDARAIANAPAPLARRALREGLRGGHPPDPPTAARAAAPARGGGSRNRVNCSSRRIPTVFRAGPASPTSVGASGRSCWPGSFKGGLGDAVGVARRLECVGRRPGSREGRALGRADRQTGRRAWQDDHGRLGAPAALDGRGGV